MGTINFVHPVFQPKVVSDKPSADGHDVSNLVALQNYMPPKGFLIDSFIRPPVNIYLTFPCNIDIAQIVLNGTVGSQKSNSFDIFTYTTFRTAETCSQRWETHGASTATNFDSFIFTPVGRLWQESSDCVTDVYCFSNPSFRPRMPFSGLSRMPTKLFNQPTLEVQMKRHPTKTLSSVSHLVVRVTKTSKGSVPGLRWIEVWGQPSLSCPLEDLDRVLAAYSKVMGDKQCTSAKHSVIQCRPPESHTGNAQHPAKPVAVPPEFLDSLTFEIMAQPMLLPSRQSIDLSTLEKYNDAEAQYGRPPKDPFTGVLYTAHSKPIVNTALKVRIDHFLMTNSSEEIFTAPRTVGKSFNQLAEKRSGQMLVQTSSLLNDSMPVPRQRLAPIRLQPPEPRPPPGVIHPLSSPPDTNPRRSVTEVMPKHAASSNDSLDLVLAGRRSFLDKQASSSSSSLSSAISSYTPDLMTRSTLATAVRPVEKRHSGDDNIPTNLVKRAKRQSSSSKGKVSVIDLTYDSDPEESSNTPASVAVDHASLSVIRNNPAATHASNLTHTLDNAIDQTLSKLPSFQNPSSPASAFATDLKPIKLECIYCTLKREVGMMYKLECGDVACRDCLSSRRRTGEIFCDQCNKTTRTKFITKLHS